MPTGRFNILSKLLLTGGARLEGKVTPSGSKNSALAIMAGALLGKGETILHNVPYIGDVITMVEVIKSLGVKCERTLDNSLIIDASEITSTETPYELVRKMRASFCVLGPILTRKGYAKVAMPGGCDIGARPIDFHVKGLQTLGAHISIEHGFVEAQAETLIGAPVYMNFPSAGATQHIMTIACLSKGVTTIHNAAGEPEVIELAAFLRQMGAKIEGEGTKTVRIEGVEELIGTQYRVPFDRMEAGTFAVAATMTQGDIRIEDVKLDHVEEFLLKLREVGAIVDSHEDYLRIRCNERPIATDIRTMPHPGFPTDMQQPFAALLSIAAGTSVVTENVYERRFKYANELVRMGADIKQEGRSAIITGVPTLNGAQVTASDLRAGAALVCAGLVAEGQTEVSGVEHIERGYENLLEKLQSLGAQVSVGAVELERNILSV